MEDNKWTCQNCSYSRNPGKAATCYNCGVARAATPAAAQADAPATVTAPAAAPGTEGTVLWTCLSCNYPRNPAKAAKCYNCSVARAADAPTTIKASPRAAAKSQADPPVTKDPIMELTRSFLPQFQCVWLSLRWKAGFLGIGGGWDAASTAEIAKLGLDGFALVSAVALPTPNTFILFFQRRIV
jgi:hypothetical protein